MLKIESKPLSDLIDTANSGHTDVANLNTAAYLAALAKVESVIQYKERQADIPDVSEEIYKCLRSVEGWEQLRCVLCHCTMFIAKSLINSSKPRL